MEYPPMGITDKDNNQSCKTGMEESCNFGDESVAICGQMQCGNKLRHCEGSPSPWWEVLGPGQIKRFHHICYLFSATPLVSSRKQELPQSLPLGGDTFVLVKRTNKDILQARMNTQERMVNHSHNRSSTTTVLISE